MAKECDCNADFTVMLIRFRPRLSIYICDECYGLTAVDPKPFIDAVHRKLDRMKKGKKFVPLSTGGKY